jgi:hypothetical protein
MKSKQIQLNLTSISACKIGNIVLPPGSGFRNEMFLKTFCRRVLFEEVERFHAGDNDVKEVVGHPCLRDDRQVSLHAVAHAVVQLPRIHGHEPGALLGRVHPLPSSLCFEPWSQRFHGFFRLLERTRKTSKIDRLSTLFDNNPLFLVI